MFRAVLTHAAEQHPADPARVPVTDDQQVAAVALGRGDEGMLRSSHRHIPDRLDPALRRRSNGRLELGRTLLPLVERPFGVAAPEDGDDVQQVELGAGGGRDLDAARDAVWTDASEPSTPQVIFDGKVAPAVRASITEQGA